MVLYVIVHVPVEVTVDWIHVHCAAVETVVKHVLSQAGVLGEAVNNQ